MIKVNKGQVEIVGTEAVVVAETMCYMKSFVERVLIPKWGSKESAQKEMNRIMEEVFSKVDVTEEEDEK
jgi:hypothetical protein